MICLRFLCVHINAKYDRTEAVQCMYSSLDVIKRSRFDLWRRKAVAVNIYDFDMLISDGMPLHRTGQEGWRA
jgi:hypothetical protein